MTPTRWIFTWAIIFVFTPILIGSVDFAWYLGGTVMGAVLMIGFALMEGRS